MTVRYVKEDEINESLLCAICRCPFVEPVELRPCRHVFCSACISRAFEQTHACPVDRSPTTHVEPASQVIKSLVDELPVFCPNKKRGCQLTCPREALPSHLKRCPHKKPKRATGHKNDTSGQPSGERVDGNSTIGSPDAVPLLTCPHCNAQQSGDLPLAQHLLTCDSVVVPCPHARFGCSTRARRSDIHSTHLAHECHFEPLKSFFEAYEARCAATESDVTSLSQRCAALEATVAHLWHLYVAAYAVNLSPSDEWYSLDRMGGQRDPASTVMPPEPDIRRDSAEAKGLATRDRPPEPASAAVNNEPANQSRVTPGTLPSVQDHPPLRPRESAPSLSRYRSHDRDSSLSVSPDMLRSSSSALLARSLHADPEQSGCASLPHPTALPDTGRLKIPTLSRREPANSTSVVSHPDVARALHTPESDTLSSGELDQQGAVMLTASGAKVEVDPSSDESVRQDCSTADQHDIELQADRLAGTAPEPSTTFVTSHDLKRAIHDVELRLHEPLARCHEDMQSLHHAYHDLSMNLHFLTNDVMARLAIDEHHRHKTGPPGHHAFLAEHGDRFVPSDYGGSSSSSGSDDDSPFLPGPAWQPSSEQQRPRASAHGLASDPFASLKLTVSPQVPLPFARSPQSTSFLAGAQGQHYRPLPWGPGAAPGLPPPPRLPLSRSRTSFGSPPHASMGPIKL